jgi:hypothetical protein
MQIDTNKDWEGYPISNIGAPTSQRGALPQGLTDIYACDYGRSWADLGGIAPAAITAMACMAEGIVVIGDFNGHILRSTDYGATWFDQGAMIPGPNNYICFIVSLGNGIAVLGDGNDHIWRSTDYGASWIDLGLVTTWEVWAAANLGNGIAVIGDGNNHVWRTTNYGLNWADLGAICTDYITAIAYLGNGIVVLADHDYHIWRSTNDGLNWADLGAICTDSIYWIASLGNGIAVLSDNDKHIWRSIDDGATWIDLGIIPASVSQKGAHFGNGITLMAASTHLWRSLDYGATWTDLGALFGISIDGGLIDMGCGIALAASQTHILRSTATFRLGNFGPNQFDKVFQFGCLGAITPNATSYLAPGNGATQANEIRIRVTRPGVLQNLFVWQRVASGAAGRTDIYTVRVNGANTAITCTLNNQTEGSDTTNQVLVAAGDQVSISLVSNNALDTSADVVAVVELM